MRYDFKPRGLISRLMVRMNRFLVRPEMAWNEGALFQRGNTELLAKAEADEIILRARGPEKKELLSVISSDLDALNATFHGLKGKVRKLVPCICSVCAASTSPELFDHDELLRRKQHDKLKVECPRSFEDVDVLAMLDGIRLDQLPEWARKEPATAKAPKKRARRKATKKAKPAPAPVKLKIFLASSEELKDDRDAFELYFLQQNHRSDETGYYLEVVRWENFLDAVSETGLQDEYNTAVKECDLFVSLFQTKTGKYTEEEFNVAHEQFKNSGKPMIFTFFKNVKIEIESAAEDDLMSLWAFKKRLKELKHFYTSYDSDEHLKRQFRDQLDKLRDAARI